MPLRRDAVSSSLTTTRPSLTMLVLLPQLGLAPVACAMDGAEAVAVVQEHGPDVVLVDLEMPLVDGVEAIKEISRISQHDSSRRDRFNRPAASGRRGCGQRSRLLIEERRARKTRSTDRAGFIAR
jgi:CheY-like chemotaxis protein